METIVKMAKFCKILPKCSGQKILKFYLKFLPKSKKLSRKLPSSKTLYICNILGFRLLPKQLDLKKSKNYLKSLPEI
jgi:hypothetical protein